MKGNSLIMDFIIGLAIFIGGGLFGMTVMALASANKDEDEECE